jgi:hypothetical protein
MVALVLASGAVQGALAAPQAWEPKRTHAVIVGVLHWQAATLSTYPTADRQDRALYDMLVRRGVPKSQIELLLDEQATLTAMRRAVLKAAARARDGDTLIFYYAGHGTSENGNACLMNYDVDTSRSDTTFTGGDLVKILAAEFKGDHVLLFADCCYSGALARAAEQLAKRGFEAATITSASDAVTSTNNWTFTHALVEILGGDSDADRNGDGATTLGEAAAEIEDAMRHFENQASGSSRFGLADDFRLSAARTPTPRPQIPAPYSLGEYVQISVGGVWKPARIVDYRAREFIVEVQRYASRQLVEIAANRVRKFQAPPPPTPAAPPSERLPIRAALAKARVGGKYKTLLEIIEVEPDYRQYGAFHDFGRYQATAYAGHAHLPTGYWVYVYPNWFIWQDQTK